MAKSELNRHHAKRIADNWRRKAKAQNREWRITRIGFGFTYKQDPYDCGIPGCYCCHGTKAYDKTQRSQARRQERLSLSEYLSEDGSNP